MKNGTKIMKTFIFLRKINKKMVLKLVKNGTKI